MLKRRQVFVIFNIMDVMLVIHYARQIEINNYTLFPKTDPTSLFDAFRSNHATEILVASVSYFRVFDHLIDGPVAFDDLRMRIGLEERPANVLFSALRAMGILFREHDNRISLTPMSREHLTSGDQFEISDYFDVLGSQNHGVLEMVERFRTNRPAGADVEGKGAAFIFHDGIESAMESEVAARRLTLALAGRARNVAPHFALNLPIENVTQLIDVGGGTGIYSIARLQRYKNLQSTIIDRPEVLKIAAELAQSSGVADRLHLVAGDMFDAEFLSTVIGEHPAELILLSNVLHDWDIPECKKLIKLCEDILPINGRLVIHDVFLNDDLGGPLPLTLYSATLFSLTEGRVYSANEYRQMITNVTTSLTPDTVVIPTLIHCGILQATKISH